MTNRPGQGYPGIGILPQHWQATLLPKMVFTLVLLLSASLLHAGPQPVGVWDFDDPQQLLKATKGANLQLHGSQTAIEGPTADNGAVRIGVGSYYICRHGAPLIGSDAYVNRYSLLIDFRVGALGPWYCFFQTSTNNQNDGDCFIRATDGGIGVGATGYSTKACQAGAWQRLIVAVDNSQGIYNIYLDGELILHGSPQGVDGRFSLDPTILLFADDNGEDGIIDVARVATYDACLSGADAAELAGVYSGDPSNTPPVVVVATAGPTQAETGQSVDCEFAATDADGDTVQVRVDWGDGSTLSYWSGLVASGQRVSFSHTYTQPGVYAMSVLSRDARGAMGIWKTVQTITITGDPFVTIINPPYLQNLKTNGITIMWEQNVAVTPQVAFGTTTNLDAQADCTQEASGVGTYIYKCVLTGLTPGTRYYYRVEGLGQVAPGGSFMTAPVGNDTFSFSVWSDSQGQNGGTYPTDPLEPTKSMMRHIAANGSRFAVTTGDLAESGNDYSGVQQFYLGRVARLLGRTIPWFVAWGNHDAASTSTIRKFADMPSKQRSGYTPGYGSFSFDYAGCHFICIDYLCLDTDIQSGWIRSDLESSASQNARFKFVFLHTPPYCERWYEGEASARTSLVPLLQKYKVDACFSGHTHEYERGFLNGVYYCITGGGSWLDFPEVVVKDWPHMTVGGAHNNLATNIVGGLVNEYVRVDVTQAGWVASLVAFHPDGTEIGVLDTFSKTLPVVDIHLNVTRNDSTITLQWTGGVAPYQLQKTTCLNPPVWQNVGTAQTNTIATDTVGEGPAIYRVLGTK